MDIPTFLVAQEKVEADEDNPLDRFIFEYEPVVGDVDFRAHLEALIAFIFKSKH